MDDIEGNVLKWRKSSKSAGGNCIEVAALPHAVLVRDSKDRSGATLEISRSEWKSFILSIRSNDNQGEPEEAS
jgi:hypothetical protein